MHVHTTRKEDSGKEKVISLSFASLLSSLKLLRMCTVTGERRNRSAPLEREAILGLAYRLIRSSEYDFAQQNGLFLVHR